MQIHANFKKIKILKTTIKKIMFLSSDFYQILCRYTKFYADSEFNLKNENSEKKCHFLKKHKN
jgi:hypothetical protein